ncbi:RNA polymerase-associated protein LEO1 [Diaphorina citri]|uniref:RNA polymerase-associated protein LEO1 n=1 Tax=Diaphorina citri TaxID=121845 RepID=A0A3Q0IXI6_DIACI|nr:RNA polymerase-associated protein LEO1 [Diaphorina citri]
MDPSQYLKNYPQPLHLHPNSSFRLHNNSRDSNSFQSNSPRSRDRPYFNRSGGGPYRHRKQNSESQYSSDGSNFNDSSSSSSMNSPYHRRFNNQRHFKANSQDDISQYVHPSMLEDPWAALIPNSITQSRQENIQRGKVQTYDYSSSDEETPASTQDNEGSDSDDEEQGKVQTYDYSSSDEETPASTQDNEGSDSDDEEQE